MDPKRTFACLMVAGALIARHSAADKAKAYVVPFVQTQTVDPQIAPFAPTTLDTDGATDNSDNPQAKHHGAGVGPSGEGSSDPTLFRWSDEAGKSSHPQGEAKGPPPLGDSPGPFGPFGPFKVEGEAGKQWEMLSRDSDGNLIMQTGANPSPDALSKQPAQPLSIAVNGQPVPPTPAALSAIFSQKQIPAGTTINGKRVSPGDQGEPGASGGA